MKELRVKKEEANQKVEKYVRKYFSNLSLSLIYKLFRKKEDFAALCKAQEGILNTVCRYVKKGGYLYYSTCSLFACENDGTVSAFLKAHPEFEAVGLESPLPHDKKKFGLQFLPDTAYGAGFYICKMRKQ